MKSMNKWWIDAIIIVGMMAVVFLLCQPIGRKWDEETTKLYSGEDGIFSYDTDTYYYLRRAKEFTENGFSSIRVIFSRSEDPLITTVRSGEKDFLPNLLSALVAMVWYFLHVVGLKISVYSLAIHFSAVLLSLFVIPIYFFLKKRVSIPASVMGALIATLAPPYFRHSTWSIFDTDALIGLLALVLVLSVYECVLSDNVSAKLGYGITSVISSLLLYCTWKVFYVYSVIAVGTTLAALLLIRMLFHKNIKEKPKLRIPLLVLGVHTAIVLLLGAFDADVVNTFVSYFGDPGTSERWPSAGKFVSELAKPQIYTGDLFWDAFLTTKVDYISYFGGLICFALLLFSVVICICRVVELIRKRKEGILFEEAFLLFSFGSWFVGTLIMSFFGMRFMEFVILPSAMIMAYGIHRINRWIISEKRTVLTKRILYLCIAAALFAVFVIELPVFACVLGGTVMVFGFFGSRLKKGYVLTLLLCSAILLGTAESAFLVNSLARPLYEKPVEEAMLWIRDNTDEDAVIINFWNFGYMYQYTSGRRTVSDGGTYNGAFTLWVAEMFSSDDREYSAAIAKMLQNGGLDATEYAEKISGGRAKACEVLKSVLALPKNEARQVLLETYGYSADEAKKLLEYTHPENCPEMYMVLDTDLLSLSGTFDYYTSWDFSGNTEARAETLIGDKSVEYPKDGETVTCNLWQRKHANYVQAHLFLTDGEMDGFVSNSKGALFDLERTVFVRNGEIVSDRIKEQAEDNRELYKDYALLVMEEDGKLSVMICDKAMIESTLFDLYLFGGRNQDVFECVYSAEVPESYAGEETSLQRRLGTQKTIELTNCGISVWKIK